MSTISSTLMVAAAIPCVAGAVSSRSQVAFTASVVMLLTMADLAFVGALPPVAWSGLLLLVGLCVAVRLRPRPKSSPAVLMVTAEPQKRLVPADATRSPTVDPADGAAESSPLKRPTEWRKARPFLRLGRTSAILSAAAYPIMAWQVLNHGTHYAADSNADAHAAHEHHGHTLDASLVNGVLTLSVVALSLLLALCAIQAITYKRPGLMLESLGMATMLTVMQFMH